MSKSYACSSYSIVGSYDGNAVEKEVNEKLSHGWRLYGRCIIQPVVIPAGVLTSAQGYIYFAQVMIKERQEPAPAGNPAID